MNQMEKSYTKDKTTGMEVNLGHEFNNERAKNPRIPVKERAMFYDLME